MTFNRIKLFMSRKHGVFTLNTYFKVLLFNCVFFSFNISLILETCLLSTAEFVPGKEIQIFQFKIFYK